MIYRDETIDGIRRAKIYFDDQIEAAEYLQSTTTNWGYDPAQSSTSWDLNCSDAATIQLARTGWSEGAQNLTDQLSARKFENEHVDSWRYDVAGELPDIGRFLAGDPAHMRRHGHPKGHMPIISLFINNWIVCTTTSKQMTNYGAALVSIVDQLESSGRRVELVAGTIAEHYEDSSIMLSATWRVKAADAPLDLAAVAFAIAHPAASRRFGWRLWERTKAPRDQLYGSGRGRVVSKHDLVDPMPGTLIINGIKMDGSSCNTLEDAIKFAAKQINEAAGEELVSVEQ